MNVEQKSLLMGNDNFRKYIEDDCYYVDKTLLIKDLLDSKSEVTLFNRPRRFEKTPNQSMLQYFFESREEDCSHILEGLPGTLKFLSECLAHYYKKPVIILIDEYDIPLENAYYNKFYDEIITFLRSLFIFTGLNNLDVISITNARCADYFRFTPEEVEQMLSMERLQENKKGTGGKAQ